MEMPKKTHFYAVMQLFCSRDRPFWFISFCTNQNITKTHE